MVAKFVPRGDFTRALAYVRVDDASAHEDAQRRAIAVWAARERVTIVASHVSQGPTSETETLVAAIDALPVVGAGWFVVASLDRLHPEWEHFAALFDSLAHEKGAQLVSADGKFDPDPGQQCPICQIPVQPSSRYPQALCGLCLREAADEGGRVLKFFNVDMTGGFRATYADTGEVRDGHVCYVRGVRCWADEARFGGIVIEPR